MNNVIDYTKLRLSAKNRIVKCPKCNRKGALRKYTDGTTMIIHKSHIAMGMFNQIDDSCFFGKGEYNTLNRI